MPTAERQELFALREARIRRLEDAYLHLRLRRARLEVSLLAGETKSSKERLMQSIANCPDLSPDIPLLTPLTLRPSVGHVWGPRSTTPPVPTAPSFPVEPLPSDSPSSLSMGTRQNAPGTGHKVTPIGSKAAGKSRRR